MNSVTSLKFAFLGVLIVVTFWNGSTSLTAGGGAELARAPLVATSPAEQAQVVETANSTNWSNLSNWTNWTNRTETPPPEIGAASVLVQEVETGETIFAKDEHMRRPIASLTKLMTAMIARELLKEDDVIAMSEPAVAQEGIAGGFAEGERFTVADLIAAALVVSSNDAAYALADANDANMAEQFVTAMNAKAREIGMFETHFEDLTGLSPLNQSTADDLARFARHLLTYDRELFEITAAPKVFIRERTTGTRRALQNINSFAGRPEFFGGKTGFTDEAGGNLLSVWQAKGRTYLIIVLGTEDRFGDTEKLVQWVQLVQ